MQNTQQNGNQQNDTQDLYNKHDTQNTVNQIITLSITTLEAN